jgi:hypothetical protein
MSLKRLPDLAWTLGGSRSGLRALVLAMLMGASCFVVLYWKQGLDAQRVEHARRLERLAQLSLLRSARPSAAAPPLSVAGMRQVNQQIALLNRDWAGLLGQLAPASHHVKLLAMDVNPATGALRITGGADDAAQANAYAEWLQRRGAMLRDVRLMLLERKAGHVQFEVTAQWSE